MEDCMLGPKEDDPIWWSNNGQEYYDDPEPEEEKPESVDAGCCPVCGDQEEENAHGYVPPIELKLCGCDHYACSRCVKHCADDGCSSTLCGDCASTCEGCAEVHCSEHVVAKNYCRHCCPDVVRHESERPAYCFEN